MEAGTPTEPRTLPEVWSAVSLQAPWWAMAGCVAIGVMGIVALSVLDVDSLASRLAFALIAILGIRGFAARATAARRDSRVLPRTRAAIDIAASLVAVALLLSLLNQLFGGNLGLIRA